MSKELSKPKKDKVDLPAPRNEDDAIGRLQQFIPEDTPFPLSQRQKGMLRSMLGSMSSTNITPGAAMSVMICKGPVCPYVRDKKGLEYMQDNGGEVPPLEERDLSNCKCPFYYNATEPIGHPCPFEAFLVDEIIKDTTAQMEDTGFDPTFFGRQIKELACWYIVEHRIQATFATTPQMIWDSNQLTKEGDVVKVNEVENIMIRALKTAQEAIQRIRQNLGITKSPKKEIERQENPAVSIIEQLLNGGQAGTNTQVGLKFENKETRGQVIAELQSRVEEDPGTPRSALVEGSGAEGSGSSGGE